MLAQRFIAGNLAEKKPAPEGRLNSAVDQPKAPQPAQTMRVIDIPQDAVAVNRLLDQARSDDLLLRAVDGTEFMLTIVDDFEHEIRRTRRNKSLMALLDERGKEAAIIPLEEIERELGLG